MKMKQSADAPQARPLPAQLMDLRTAAVLNGAGAVAILIGAGLLAKETGYVELTMVGLTALLPALRAAWLWRYTSRMAELLPQRPAKERRPGHWLRLWWWLRSRPVRPRPVAEPFRRVRVGEADEVLMPRQPGEMRLETEEPIVAEYTKSDVYFVVCRAAQVGLSERAKDTYGRPVWLFGDGQRLVLPSGAQ
jgi:hypothetical protein